MAKKRNKDIQPVEGVFSDRPRVKKVIQEAVAEPEVENTIIEPVVDEKESILEVEEPVQESEQSSSKDTVIIYDEYKVRRGAKENGILLAIILLVLILFSLGFLIYYEHSWRLQEQEQETVVNSKYDELRNIVKNYVSTITDSNKDKYCQELKEVYLNAATSTDTIDVILKSIQEQSQEILGFNDRVAKTNEYEWYKLFGVHGVIDTWVTETGVGFTKQNQKEVFTAIAEGLK